MINYNNNKLWYCLNYNNIIMKVNYNFILIIIINYNSNILLYYLNYKFKIINVQ